MSKIIVNSNGQQYNKLKYYCVKNLSIDKFGQSELQLAIEKQDWELVKKLYPFNIQAEKISYIENIVFDLLELYNIYSDIEKTVLLGIVGEIIDQLNELGESPAKAIVAYKQINNGRNSLST